VIARGFQTYGEDYKIDKAAMAIEIKMSGRGTVFHLQGHNPGEVGGKARTGTRPRSRQDAAAKMRPRQECGLQGRKRTNRLTRQPAGRPAQSAATPASIGLYPQTPFRMLDCWFLRDATHRSDQIALVPAARGDWAGIAIAWPRPAEWHHYLNSKTEAAQTVKEIEALGRRALAVECDVRSEALVRGAIAATTSQFGGWTFW